MKRAALVTALASGIAAPAHAQLIDDDAVDAVDLCTPSYLQADRVAIACAADLSRSRSGEYVSLRGKK